MMNVLNFAVAQAILDRDRPDADRDEINRYSLLAAFVPGAAGLVVPFIAEQNLPASQPSAGPPSAGPPALGTGATSAGATGATANGTGAAGTPASGAAPPATGAGGTPASTDGAAITARLDNTDTNVAALGVSIAELRTKFDEILTRLPASTVTVPAGAGPGSSSGPSTSRVTPTGK